MTPGIFISYSRNDQKQAFGLLAMLRREGYNVWIDQEAIPGASIWSDEIVQNIKNCDIFIALLSSSSVTSPNVGKEIGLAAEFGKTILPVEIGKVELPGRLEYALAGIQRTDFHNEEAILHAIRKIAARSGEPEIPVKPHMSRKRRIQLEALGVAVVILIVGAGFFLKSRAPQKKEVTSNLVVVLPFATMNLDQDSIHNLDVFSDGILKRLAAQNLLIVEGPSASSAYKESRLNPLAIARELKARYIVEGLVRKQNDVDFVSVRIFDVNKGGELWEQFYRGNIRELFDIREKVCGDIYDYLGEVSGNERGLKESEAKALNNPNDARANADYATRLIGNDNIRSLDFFQRAIKADSTNESYYIKGGIVAERLKNGGIARELGAAGAQIAKAKLQFYPDSVNLATSYAIALDVAGQVQKAENIYDSLLKKYPKDSRLNFNAACNYSRQGKADKAIDILEKLLAFAPGRVSETRSDPDFDNIRMYPRYAKLMDQLSSR